MYSICDLLGIRLWIQCISESFCKDYVYIILKQKAINNTKIIFALQYLMLLCTNG